MQQLLEVLLALKFCEILCHEKAGKGDKEFCGGGCGFK